MNDEEIANLINNSEIPVIAVPYSYKSSKITNMLYASDLTNLSKKLEIVAAFAKPIQAEVQLLHFSSFLENNIDQETYNLQLLNQMNYK
tara:strand:+ start:475 stop:741 length:267 start_codon:yes stop_codon:yes gene_type:complete